MTVLHTGSTKKFAAGWETIFQKSGGKSGSTAGKKKAVARKSTANKRAKK